MKHQFSISRKIAAVTLFAAVLLSTPTNAWADFKVYIGYSGGPYYEKICYSDYEMQVMSDAKLYEYTAFDSLPALRKGFGYGVRIESLFANAGISSSELKRFYFSTKDAYLADGEVELKSSWAYVDLLETARYYFPNLLNTYDFEEQEITDYDKSWEGAMRVPAIIAYSSSFSRVFSAYDEAWTSTAYMSHNGYRLMFGQSDPATDGMGAGYVWVRAMTCIFNGTPELSFGIDESDNLFEAEVGETITIQAPAIYAADPLIEQNAKYDFQWSVSDSDISDFVRDENGNVIIGEDGSVQLTIYSEGDASVSAEYGNSPSSEYRASATAGVKGIGSDSGGGDGGDDSGSGTDSGDGAGESGAGDSGSGIGDQTGTHTVVWTQCGTCEWQIDESGKLTVRPLDGTGTGVLENWGSDCDNVPWFSKRESVKSVVIESSVVAQTCDNMFYGCSNLKSVDLSGLDTSQVNSMSYMFYGCSSIVSVGLSGFDTSEVKNMSRMFFGCSSLETIYVSKGFSTDSVASSGIMFFGCTSLVGGNGTKYSSSYVNATYAHIDGGEDNPGYFTYKRASWEGDVNNNGVINCVDALVAYDISNGIYGNDKNFADMKKRADVDWNDTVDSGDAFAILYASVYGWEN